MNRKFAEPQPEGVNERNTTRQILFLATVISTLFGFLYLLGLTGKLIINGSIHATSSPAIQMVSGAIGLLWDIDLLIVFVALRRLLSRRDSIYAELALIFMVLLCATSSINWFVQLVLVPRIAHTDQSTILALIDINGESSIMYAIEHLGWGVFYGFATIFMGLIMDSGKIENPIRWLFVVGGVLSILHVFGVIFANLVLIELGYLAAGVLLPITTTLLAFRFRKNDSIAIDAISLPTNL